MIPRPSFELPASKRASLERAARLEIWTLALMATVIPVMFLAMGGSQAMKAAWVEDLLGLIPAIAFFVARHFEGKPPDERYPFGRYKAVSISYAVSAVALLILAIYLMVDSSMKLIQRHHPTIGSVTLLGQQVWMGWLMIAALIYSMIPPIILGKLKKPIAHEIHDKVLLADASMQAADWKTAGAAIVGLVGVGFGLWWADAVAAILISLDVLRDGWTHLLNALRDLADEAPQAMDGSGPEPAIAEAKRAVEALDWVKCAEPRFRTEGRLITGLIAVEMRGEVSLTPDRRRAIEQAVRDNHWRYHAPTVVVLDPAAGKLPDQA